MRNAWCLPRSRRANVCERSAQVNQCNSAKMRVRTPRLRRQSGERRYSLRPLPELMLQVSTDVCDQVVSTPTLFVLAKNTGELQSGIVPPRVQPDGRSVVATGGSLSKNPAGVGTHDGRQRSMDCGLGHPPRPPAGHEQCSTLPRPGTARRGDRGLTPTAARKQTLELTWVGKEERPKLDAHSSTSPSARITRQSAGLLRGIMSTRLATNTPYLAAAVPRCPCRRAASGWQSIDRTRVTLPPTARPYPDVSGPGPSLAGIS